MRATRTGPAGDGRRRLGLPLLALWCALWMPATRVDADASPVEQRLRVRGLHAQELARMAAQLGAADPERRAAAVRALSDLNVESLPGIEQRLAQLRAGRPDPEAAKAALTVFRHAAGSRRADDEVDLAQGVLPGLGTQRDAVALAMAEPLLYVRALERMSGREAGLRMAELLVLDPPGVWDQQVKLARARAGRRLLPALLELRSHGDSRVRGWALAGVSALGMDDPEVVAQLDDPHLLAQAIEAYSRPLDFAAMPAVVRLVTAEKQQVRDAARAAVARFGKNAIWQLRELYQQLTGRAADKAWDAQRTASELYAVIDRPATEEAQTLLARGMQHFVAGELDAMQRDYDRVLARYPRFAERAKMAPGYAALGRLRLQQDRLEPARDAFARALRLAPEAGDAAQLQAELAFVEAELALVSGVVDLDGYAVALRHEPDHARASEAEDRLSGASAARERVYRRLAAGAAIALLLVCIAVLVRGRRRHLPVRSGA